MAREIDVNELLWDLVFIPDPREKRSYHAVHVKRDGKGFYIEINKKKRYLESGDEVMLRLRPVKDIVKLRCNY